MKYEPRIILDSTPSCLDLYRIHHGGEPDILYNVKIKSYSSERFEEFVEKIHKEFSEICESERIHYKELRYKADDMQEVIFYNDNSLRGFYFGIETNSYGSDITANFCCSKTNEKSVIGSFFIDYMESELNDVKVNHTSKVYIIYKDEYGLSLKPFKIRKANTNNKQIDLFDLYNDDFKEVSSRIEEALGADMSENYSNGITLLHGDVGTGKTSYLRHLIRTINKKIIYLPPDLSTEISSPAFISFLMSHPDSILIIEDAETILKTREAGGNQAVSNILNMSDGILGDALSLQIICTFNDDIENIDKALLREGRLVEIYSFEELSKDKTAKLYKKLYDSDNPPKEKMTLAQIFNDEQFVRNGEKGSDKPKFGFI